MPSVTRERPVNINDSPFESAWINYINSLKLLLVPIPHDRGMDQYLEFRDAVLQYVLSPSFIHELNRQWEKSDRENRGSLNLLLLELQAFPRAIEAAKAEADAEDEVVIEKEEKRKKKWWQFGWLGRASTVAGSVKDLLDNLPGPAKSGLIILKELLDLFKGK